MLKLKTKTSTITDWNQYGRHASETHKDYLIDEMLSELSFYNAQLKCTDNWLFHEKDILINKMANLIYNISSIPGDIHGYVLFDDKTVKELVITSKEYNKHYFDAITDLILDYEEESRQVLNYFYVKSIETTPKNAIPF